MMSAWRAGRRRCARDEASKSAAARCWTKGVGAARDGASTCCWRGKCVRGGCLPTRRRSVQHQLGTGHEVNLWRFAPGRAPRAISSDRLLAIAGPRIAGMAASRAPMVHAWPVVSPRPKIASVRSGSSPPLHLVNIYALAGTSIRWMSRSPSVRPPAARLYPGRFGAARRVARIVGCWRRSLRQHGRLLLTAWAACSGEPAETSRRRRPDRSPPCWRRYGR
jgi:hypothetical protein